MKVPFKIDGKSYMCPTSWVDVSTKQYQDLKSCDLSDDIMILSIILGIDYDIMYRTKQFDVDDKIAPLLKFLNRPFDGTNLPPVSYITIDGKKYDIPKDLTQFSFGQKIAAKNKMNNAIEKNNDVYSCISDIVAIYIQPIVTGTDFDEKQTEKFAREVIDHCSIIETYVVATFFLNKLFQLERKKQLPYPLNLIKNKWLQGYLNWTYSKKSIQLMHLPGETY